MNLPKEFVRRYWILILGVAVLAYVLWKGAHDQTAPGGAGREPGFGVNAENISDLDGLMSAATAGASNTVTIAGETVKLS